MATMSELVQFLLAYRKPGGGHICRYGGIQTTIPFFPPNFSIAFTLRPEFGSYATIYFRGVQSPSQVPNAFWIDFTHSGMSVSSGFIGESLIGYGMNSWIVITESEPAIQVMTNLTDLGQFCEAASEFLIVDSEENLKALDELVAEWGISQGVKEQLNETNLILRQLAGGAPAPYPAIGR